MSTTETIAPHGGTLVDLILDREGGQRAAEEAEHLPKVSIGTRELSDLEMMAVGALSPLTGFMGEKDYRSVLELMHLANGLPWTIPVTLSIQEEEAKRIVPWFQHLPEGIALGPGSADVEHAPGAEADHRDLFPARRDRTLQHRGRIAEGWPRRRRRHQ